MRGSLTILPVLLFAASAAAGEDGDPRLTWHHEGYRALAGAAKLAKEEGSRVLVGLSGSPH